jgi:hypothetical protein
MACVVSQEISSRIDVLLINMQVKSLFGIDFSAPASHGMLQFKVAIFSFLSSRRTGGAVNFSFPAPASLATIVFVSGKVETGRISIKHGLRASPTGASSVYF